MWAAFLLGGCLVVGLLLARWWLLPVPLVVALIIDAAAPVPPDDDISGIGRFILFIASTVVLTVGIGAGKLARQRGDRPPEGNDPSN
jgi:hypothetical protein